MDHPEGGNFFGESEEGGIQSRTMNGTPYYGWGGASAPPMPPNPDQPIPLFQPPPGVNQGMYYPPPHITTAPPYPNIGFHPPHMGAIPPIVGRQMECPICKKQLAPPIYQCNRGHTICSSCIERLDYCISELDCMSDLEGPKIRNVALEQACHSYQSYPVSCPHARMGCTVVVPGEHMAGHLQVCQFRGYLFCSKYFGWTSCNEYVSRFNFLDHLRDYHNVKTTDQDNFTLKLVAQSHLFHNLSSLSTAQQGLVWTPVIIEPAAFQDENERILLKCFVSPHGFLTLAGYLLAPSSDSEWKRYRIKFQIDSTSKTARLEWTGCLIFQSLNEPNAMYAPGQNVSTNVNTLRIPLHCLEEYIKPSHREDDDDETDSSSKIKIRVCVWKLDEEADGFGRAPFKECFINSETDQEEEPQEKLTLFGEFPGEVGSGSNAFSLLPSDEPQNGHNLHAARTAGQWDDEEEYTKYYSPEASCNHCNRPLFGDVIYQCLQCPSEAIATYFCRGCIEQGGIHMEHLTIRISKPALQPLAAVAFECAAGELH